jgi:hypothetical protein
VAEGAALATAFSSAGMNRIRFRGLSQPPDLRAVPPTLTAIILEIALYAAGARLAPHPDSVKIRSRSAD